MSKSKLINIVGSILITVASFIIVYKLYFYLSNKVHPVKPEVTESANTSTTEAQKATEAQQPAEAQQLANAHKVETKQPAVQTIPKTQAYDFTVVDSSGKQVKLSDFKGKPVVLNFWATWCPYCVDEMPLFEDTYKKNSDISFLMIDVTDGQRETQDIGKSFISSKNFTFPVYYDTANEAATAYNLASMPQTCFIDKDGNIVAIKIGECDAQALQDGIAAIK